MKRFVYGTLAVAAIFSMFSCKKENWGDYQVSDGVNITGEFDPDYQKTAIDNDGKVSWNPGDKVTFVWNKSYYLGSDEDIKLGYRMSTNSKKETSSTASFTAKLPYRDAISGGYAEVLGVYPGERGYITTVTNDNEFKIQIPNSYDFSGETDGGFALASITAAKVVFQEGEKASAVFKNICALFKVTVPAGTATIAAKVPDSSSPLAGYATISTGDNFPGIASVAGPNRTVTVTVSADGLADAGTFYLPILPGKVQGLRFAAIDKDGHLLADKYEVKAVDVARGAVWPIDLTGGHFSSGKRFMCVGGSGDKTGVNWENAWGLEEFAANINRSVSDGVTVYIKAGQYDITSAVDNDSRGGIWVTDKTITLIGSFPTGNTGVKYDNPDIDSQATVFDGGGNTEGGGNTMFAFEGTNVTMQHIKFAHAGVKTAKRGTALYYTAKPGETNITASFTKCYFVENYNSLTDFATGGVGGAVYCANEHSTGSITAEFSQCRFERNSTGHSGGAVYLCAANGKTVKTTISDCDFIDNESRTARGGAIHLQGGNLTVTGSRFYGNQASTFGGAISMAKAEGTNDSSLQIQGNIFGASDKKPNTALDEQGQGNGGGGALHARIEDVGSLTGTVSVVSKGGNSFYGNKSSRSGGAISLYNGASFESCGDIFQANESELGNGGAIAAYYGCALTLAVNGSQPTQFSSNSAFGEGGAVWTNASNMKTGQTAYSACTISSTGSTYDTNTCPSGGGAVSVIGYTGKEGTVVFSDDTFSSNTVTGGGSGGGAVKVTNTALTMRSCTLTDNSAASSSTDSDGGAVYIWKCAKSEISNSNFYSNSANRDGGALYVNACEGLTVSGCIFGASSKGNTATRHGGAVRIIATTGNKISASNRASFSDNTFAYNTAGDRGGAVAVINDASTAVHNIGFSSVSNTFSNNTAANYGGALAFYRADSGDFWSDDTEKFCTISGCTFANNTVSGAAAEPDRNMGGSAIHCQGCLEEGSGNGKPVILRVGGNCKFNANTSPKGSAAILLGLQAHLQMSDSYFYNNQAAYSADLRLCDQPSTTQSEYAYITNCVFENSQSSATDAYGISISVGAVDRNSQVGTMAINNCSFYGQKPYGTPIADGERCVIFCRHNPALIINTTFFGSALATYKDLPPSMLYLRGLSIDYKIILCNNIISGTANAETDVHSIKGNNSFVDTQTFGHNWMYQPNNDFGEDFKPENGHMNRNNTTMRVPGFNVRNANWGGDHMNPATGYLSFTNNIGVASYADPSWVEGAVTVFDEQFKGFYGTQTAKNFFNGVKYDGKTSLQVDICGADRGTCTLPGSWHNTVPDQKEITPNITNPTSGEQFNWGGAK